MFFEKNRVRANQVGFTLMDTIDIPFLLSLKHKLDQPIIFNDGNPLRNDEDKYINLFNILKKETIVSDNCFKENSQKRYDPISVPSVEMGKVIEAFKKDKINYFKDKSTKEDYFVEVMFGFGPSFPANYDPTVWITGMVEAVDTSEEEQLQNFFWVHIARVPTMTVAQYQNQAPLLTLWLEPAEYGAIPRKPAFHSGVSAEYLYGPTRVHQHEHGINPMEVIVQPEIVVHKLTATTAVCEVVSYDSERVVLMAPGDSNPNDIGSGCDIDQAHTSAQMGEYQQKCEFMNEEEFITCVYNTVETIGVSEAVVQNDRPKYKECSFMLVNACISMVAMCLLYKSYYSHVLVTQVKSVRIKFLLTRACESFAPTHGEVKANQKEYQAKWRDLPCGMLEISERNDLQLIEDLKEALQKVRTGAELEWSAIGDVIEWLLDTHGTRLRQQKSPDPIGLQQKLRSYDSAQERMRETIRNYSRKLVAEIEVEPFISYLYASHTRGVIRAQGGQMGWLLTQSTVYMTAKRQRNYFTKLMDTCELVAPPDRQEAFLEHIRNNESTEDQAAKCELREWVQECYDRYVRGQNGSETTTAQLDATEQLRVEVLELGLEEVLWEEFLQYALGHLHIHTGNPECTNRLVKDFLFNRSVPKRNIHSDNQEFGKASFTTMAGRTSISIMLQDQDTARHLLSDLVKRMGNGSTNEQDALAETVTIIRMHSTRISTTPKGNWREATDGTHSACSILAPLQAYALTGDKNYTWDTVFNMSLQDSDVRSLMRVFLLDKMKEWDQTTMGMKLQAISQWLQNQPANKIERLPRVLWLTAGDWQEAQQGTGEAGIIFLVPRGPTDVQYCQLLNRGEVENGCRGHDIKNFLMSMRIGVSGELGHMAILDTPMDSKEAEDKEGELVEGLAKAILQQYTVNTLDTVENNTRAMEQRLQRVKLQNCSNDPIAEVGRLVISGIPEVLSLPENKRSLIKYIRDFAEASKRPLHEAQLVADIEAPNTPWRIATFKHPSLLVKNTMDATCVGSFLLQDSVKIGNRGGRQEQRVAASAVQWVLGTDQMWSKIAVAQLLPGAHERLTVVAVIRGLLGSTDTALAIELRAVEVALASLDVCIVVNVHRHFQKGAASDKYPNGLHVNEPTLLVMVNKATTVRIKQVNDVLNLIDGQERAVTQIGARRYEVNSSIQAMHNRGGLQLNNKDYVIHEVTGLRLETTIATALASWSTYTSTAALNCIHAIRPMNHTSTSIMIVCEAKQPVCTVGMMEDLSDGYVEVRNMRSHKTFYPMKEIVRTTSPKPATPGSRANTPAKTSQRDSTPVKPRQSDKPPHKQESVMTDEQGYRSVGKAGRLKERSATPQPGYKPTEGSTGQGLVQSQQTQSQSRSTVVSPMTPAVVTGTTPPPHLHKPTPQLHPLMAKLKENVSKAVTGKESMMQSAETSRVKREEKAARKHRRELLVQGHYYALSEAAEDEEEADVDSEDGELTENSESKTDAILTVEKTNVQFTSQQTVGEVKTTTGKQDTLQPTVMKTTYPDSGPHDDDKTTKKVGNSKDSTLTGARTQRLVPQISYATFHNTKDQHTVVTKLHRGNQSTTYSDIQNSVTDAKASLGTNPTLDEISDSELERRLGNRGSTKSKQKQPVNLAHFPEAWTSGQVDNSAPMATDETYSKDDEPLQEGTPISNDTSVLRKGEDDDRSKALFAWMGTLYQMFANRDGTQGSLDDLITREDWNTLQTRTYEGEETTLFDAILEMVAAKVAVNDTTPRFGREVWTSWQQATLENKRLLVEASRLATINHTTLLEQIDALARTSVILGADNEALDRGLRQLRGEAVTPARPTSRREARNFITQSKARDQQVVIEINRLREYARRLLQGESFPLLPGESVASMLHNRYEEDYGVTKVILESSPIRKGKDNITSKPQNNAPPTGALSNTMQSLIAEVGEVEIVSSPPRIQVGKKIRIEAQIDEQEITDAESALMEGMDEVTTPVKVVQPLDGTTNAYNSGESSCNAHV